MAVSALRSSRPDSSPSIGIQADAEARRDVEVSTVDEKCGLQRIQYLLREHAHVGGLRDVVQQDHEFIAAETRDGVALAQTAVEAPRELLQQAVASVVPEGIVDVLEAVEVEEHHRDQTVVPARV